GRNNLKLEPVVAGENAGTATTLIIYVSV
ncbi:MAG: hypothetical protein QG555_1349, partial [Thermodesulfobacteriota bacterium]|nr:hypothetical protein [Thermodesulfobacteriota bacterium]